MSEDKNHSKFSASGSERWLQCPGSVKLEEKAPPSFESAAAKEGTLAHDYLEKWLLKLKKNPWAIEPAGLRSEKPDMYPAVKKAVMWVRDHWERESQELLVEEKISLSFIHPEMFGTGDVGLVETFDTLTVVDYKHGVGHAVNMISRIGKRVLRNTQLMYYLLGIAKKYNFEFRKYKIGIIQPRADHKDGPIRLADVSAEELKTYVDLFSEGVEATQKKNPTLNVGPWCWFCRAREHNCPKQEQVRLEKNENMFDEAW